MADGGGIRKLGGQTLHDHKAWWDGWEIMQMRGGPSNTLLVIARCDKGSQRGREWQKGEGTSLSSSPFLEAKGEGGGRTKLMAKIN